MRDVPGGQILFGEPPGNVELEIGLLGALLTKRRLYDDIADLVAAEDFIELGHQRLFAKISELARLDQPTTAAALTPYFVGEDLKTLADVGGAKYIASLAKEATFATVDGPGYARAIRDAAKKRSLIGWAQDVIADAFTPDPTRSAAMSLKPLSRGWTACSMATPPTKSRPSRSARQHNAHSTGLSRPAERDGVCVGVATGYAALDEMIGGMGEGELYVLAGRPGMGESALAEGIAQRVARAGTGVAFFS